MSSLVFSQSSPGVRVPKYRRRILRGKTWAYVTFYDPTTKARRDHNLGEYDSPVSHERYRALVAEWLASGGGVRQKRKSLPGVTIHEVCYAWLREALAEKRYADRHIVKVKRFIAVLCRMYGSTRATAFGPNALRAWRNSLLQPDPAARRIAWSHSTVKSAVDSVKHMFRWAVAREMLPPSCWESLRSLESLRRPPGVRKRVLPVSARDVALTLRRLRDPVASMVRLQWATGMRPGELVIMRPCDIDTKRAPWVYRPSQSKGEWLGRERVVELGPKARRILAPFLAGTPRDAFVFSPAAGMHEMRIERAARRVTPTNQGNSPGTNVKAEPRRVPGEHYTTESYRRAITRACELAGIPSWHPHRLRHSFATRMRQAAGLEAAQLALGHSSALITEAVYAERSSRLVRAAIERVG